MYQQCKSMSPSLDRQSAVNVELCSLHSLSKDGHVWPHTYLTNTVWAAPWRPFAISVNTRKDILLTRCISDTSSFEVSGVCNLARCIWFDLVCRWTFRTDPSWLCNHCGLSENFEMKLPSPATSLECRYRAGLNSAKLSDCCGAMPVVSVSTGSVFDLTRPGC